MDVIGHEIHRGLQVMFGPTGHMQLVFLVLLGWLFKDGIEVCEFLLVVDVKGETTDGSFLLAFDADQLDIELGGIYYRLHQRVMNQKLHSDVSWDICA